MNHAQLNVLSSHFTIAKEASGGSDLREDELPASANRFRSNRQLCPMEAAAVQPMQRPAIVLKPPPSVFDNRPEDSRTCS